MGGRRWWVRGLARSSSRYDAADNLTQHSSGTVQALDAANQLTAAAGITVVGAGGAANNATASVPAGLAAGDQIIVAVTMPDSKKASTPAGCQAGSVASQAGSPPASQILRMARGLSSSLLT